MKTAQTILERLSQPHAVTKVKDWLRENKERGRTALATFLCRTLHLRDARGTPRLAGVQVALRQLESRGFWKLPPSLSAPERSSPQPRRLNQPVPPPQEVPAKLEQVQGLKLVLVRATDDELWRTWNELILTEHPLKDGCLVGRQLRYLVGSAHGWLGAIGFASCALYLRARDEWIGWDEATRKQYQEHVINMTRFLIRAHVPNLASRVLGLCAERVGKDFQARYKVEPWLLESFVDSEQHAGTCYRAANWQPIGLTLGCGRNASSPEPTKTRKAIFLYELERNWRKKMGLPERSEKIPPVALEEVLASGKWIEAEFGNVDLGHQDREDRLRKIVANKAQNPAGSYPECVDGDRQEMKAYYNFLGQEEVSPRGILQGHRERTVGRMKEFSRVLVIQDTTELDFSERLHCNGLGEVGKNQTGAVNQGLEMHSEFVVSETGLPLGVLDTRIYASHFGEGEKKASQNRPIEEKESYRWLQGLDDVNEVLEYLPKTKVVVVADRESDIFELFDHRRRQTPHLDLLVRARVNRRLEESSQKLFEHLEALPVKAEARMAVPRQRERKGKPSKPGRVGLAARTARVQLRWDQVTLAAPETAQTRNLEPVELWALLLVEPHPPEGVPGLRWVLLTTVPIGSRKQALEVLRWYRLRWRIEEWHRVLKSGCRVEAHQQHTAERLARAIAIDAVMGWRVMLLALLGRENPELPAELVFSAWECQLLEKLQPLLAPETMSKKKLRIGVATRILSRLGGALQRNAREPAGAQTLLRGLRRFQDMASGGALLAEDAPTGSATSN
jgi:Domain of unknown function (DUF4338)/Transposase DNA-binding/Transposase Tn5 dimerisation domain